MEILKEQWQEIKAFRENILWAFRGPGFDPGVTNVFIAYAQKHYFDEIEYIDILDCNDGDHGYPFATHLTQDHSPLYLGGDIGRMEYGLQSNSG